MAVGFNDSNIINEVSMTYSFLEDIFKFPYKEKRIRYRDNYLENARFFLTVFCTMMSYLIGYAYEKTKDYDDKIFDEALNEFSFWKKIKCKNELSATEKFKQFRNCFEHANFLFCLDSGKDEQENYLVDKLVEIKYYFNNDKIEGEIEFKEFVKLYGKCIDLFTKFNKDNKITLYLLILDLYKLKPIRNEKDLNTFMNAVVVRDVSASYNAFSTKVNVCIDDSYFNDFAHFGTAKRNYEWNDNTRYTDSAGSVLNIAMVRDYISNKVFLGMNQFNIVSRKLNESEKDKIRKHALFVTNNFSEPYFVSDDNINQLFIDDKICFKAENVILGIMDELLNNSFNKYSLFDFQKRIVSSGMTTQFYDNVMALSPGLYLTTIMSSAHFFMNYLFEINKKLDGNMFRYSEIDMTDIEVENKTNDKLVKITDPISKEKDELLSIKKQLLEMNRRLEWSKQQLEILNNPKNRDPNKLKKLSEIEGFISNFDERKMELEMQEKQITDKVDGIGNISYNDSYHLFRHLRNSIAHGRFVVDFDNGYECMDLGESQVVFYDIDDGLDDTIENASVIIKMKLKRFEKLSKDLSKVVCSQMEKRHYVEVSNAILRKH